MGMGLRVKVQLNWTGQTERILGARVSASMRGNPSYADRIIWRGIRKAWQGVHGAEKKLDDFVQSDYNAASHS